MSLLRDSWMTPAKRRLLRRSVAGGPYGPPLPEGALPFEDITSTGIGTFTANAATVEDAQTFSVGDVVRFIATAGPPAARSALTGSAGEVIAVDPPQITFTGPDMMAMDTTGLEVSVVKMSPDAESLSVVAGDDENVFVAAVGSTIAFAGAAKTVYLAPVGGTTDQRESVRADNRAGPVTATPVDSASLELKPMPNLAALGDPTGLELAITILQ